MERISWGKELWDQGENIALHTKRGIEFLERYGNFLTERYKVENDYAKQLKLLTSKYLPKKREEDDYQFTHRKAFLGILSELTDVANQHERVAEQFRDEIVSEIGQLSRKLKEQRKENLEHGLLIQNQLGSSVEMMRKTMKDYTRAFKESEAAKLKFERADRDMNLSRAEVEKARNNSIIKAQQAEDAKTTYALQLQRTNEFQREYYMRLLPTVFEQLRELDENRITEISRLMSKCVEIEQSILPIVRKCLDGMLEHSVRVDAEKDSSAVVQRYKSGYGIPEDYPFDNLNAEGSSNGGDSPDNRNGENTYGRNGQIVPPSPGVGTTRKVPQRKPSNVGSIVTRVQSKRGKLANLFKSKSTDDHFKDDYSDLPPQQQCIRLEQRIDSIQRQIETKIAQKDGLSRMKSVYRESPQLGDVAQVEVEYHKCASELSALQADLTKYQHILKDASSRLNMPINAISPTQNSNSCRESICSSTFSSFASTPISTPRAPPPSRPPPPVVTRSSSICQQRSNATDEDDTVGGSGSEYSVGGCRLDDNTKKSRTSTPSSSNSGSGNGASTTDSGVGLYKTSTVLSASPESGFGSAAGSSSSGVALAVAEDYDEWAPSDEDREEIYQNKESIRVAETITILGTCKAVYDFSGDGDGMISMKEGEQMLLLERDAGDGWTKVRKENSVEGGFVPTSYLECKWYPED